MAKKNKGWDYLDSDDVNSISDAVEPDTVVKEKTVTDQLKKMINSDKFSNFLVSFKTVNHENRQNIEKTKLKK